jgi:hypothetical protein
MPPVGFELTISAGEQPQTYALDHAATGTGLFTFIVPLNAFTPVQCTEVGSVKKHSSVIEIELGTAILTVTAEALQDLQPTIKK